MGAVIESDARPMPAQPAPQPDSITSLIQSIERAALNPKVNVEKMERLFKMSQEAMVRHAEVEFNAAMAACQAEMPVVKRDAENEQTHSWYTRLETLNAAIVPIYTRHGFSLSFGEEDCPKEGYIRIVCHCSHRAGHTRLYRADVPLDLAGIKGNVNKTPMHAFGSSFSYARRYITLPIFNVAMAGEDNDGNGAGGRKGANGGDPPPSRYITEKQHADLIAKIEEVGVNKENFRKFLKVDSFYNLLAKRYDAAIQVLKDRAKGVR